MAKKRPISPLTLRPFFPSSLHPHADLARNCSTGFLQALRLSTSSVRIAAGGVNVTVFVDALRNAVRLRAQSTTSQPLASVDLRVESVRGTTAASVLFPQPSISLFPTFTP